MIHSLNVSTRSEFAIYFGNMGSSADHLNTNEQVLIAQPTIGNWEVRSAVMT